MSNRRIAFLRVVGPLDPVTGNAASAVLYSVRIDGTHLRRLSEPGIDWVYEDRYARVSRDGSYLTFQRLRLADFKAALFRMAPDGSHVRQLTSWELNADLYDLSTARSGPTKDLIAFQSVGRSGPQWSPDSTSLVVIDRSNIDDPNAEIWTTRSGGTEAQRRNISNSVNFDFRPAWGR